MKGNQGNQGNQRNQGARSRDNRHSMEHTVPEREHAPPHEMEATQEPSASAAQQEAADPPQDRPALHVATQDLLTAPHPHAPDSPTTMLITTLRDELSTLTDQSTVLNAKLLASLDRVATLEDAVYQATTAQREKEERIAGLETQKAQWEESMNTGLLVERKVVKDEMQRLVEGLVEEEKRRGSAEEGRARVEREVDDLSATLFEQVRTLLFSLVVRALTPARQTPWSPPNAWPAPKRNPGSVKPRRICRRRKPR